MLFKKCFFLTLCVFKTANCQRDHGDSLAHPKRSCNLRTLKEALVEASPHLDEDPTLEHLELCGDLHSSH